jgi:hypothetical protein
MSGTAELEVQLLGLSSKLHLLTTVTLEPSTKPQNQLDKSSVQLSRALDQSANELVIALDRASDAAKEAAQASQRYASRLMVASWALVLVTMVLAVSIWLHR